MPNYNNDANCMGSWPMECDGNELDVSGKGGTLTETSGDIPQDADRKFGDYSRDWTYEHSEYLTHADNNFTDIFGANQNISIVVWIKAESDAGAYEGIVSKYDYSNNTRQYIIYRVSAGVPEIIQFRLSSDGTAITDAKGATSTTMGTWFHLAAVYNDTDMRIYIEGSLDSNGADNPKTYSSGIAEKGAAFMIGAFQDSAPITYYSGLIDDAGIFDRELSSVEVSDIQTNGMAGAVENPYPVDWLIKKKPTGYACFLNQYIKAKVLNYDPLKLPDGTVW